MFEKIWKFVRGRLKEKSTLTAIVGAVVWVVSYFGFQLDAEAMLGVSALVGGIFTVVLSATKLKDSVD